MNESHRPKTKNPREGLGDYLKNEGRDFPNDLTNCVAAVNSGLSILELGMLEEVPLAALPKEYINELYSYDEKLAETIYGGLDKDKEGRMNEKINELNGFVGLLNSGIRAEKSEKGKGLQVIEENRDIIGDILKEIHAVVFHNSELT